MRRAMILVSLAAISAFALCAGQSAVAQGDKGLVSIQARGDDVRSVLHDLFTQSKRNYVLEPGVRFVLYLSLKEVDFDEALQIVLKNASLEVEMQNGIYFIGKAKQSGKATSSASGPEPKIVASEIVKKSPPQALPKGTLPETVLSKRITTRFAKVDIRTLIASLSQQTGIAIEIDPKVPAYKLDAFLINTSLKYALDEITSAAGLTYKFTDRKSICVNVKPETGSVKLSESAAKGG